MEERRQSDDHDDDLGESWRDDVAYSTSSLVCGAYQLSISEMEELPLAASLFMLAEMNEQKSEISGKTVWAGSQILGHYIQTIEQKIKEKTIVELGSGTGICSIIADKLGGKTVIATDGDPEVVDLLHTNLTNNHSHAKAQSLWWGNGESLTYLKEEYPQGFDVILAADVLYKKDFLHQLFTTVTQLLSRNDPSSMFLLCHIPRADVTHELVQQTAEQFQLKTSLCPFDSTQFPSTCKKEDFERAKIYQFQRLS